MKKIYIVKCVIPKNKEYYKRHDFDMVTNSRQVAKARAEHLRSLNFKVCFKYRNIGVKNERG